MKYSVIFAGTPSVACPALEALIQDDRFDVKLVISQLDKPVGRKQELLPTPVKAIANKYDIPIEQPSKIQDIEDKIKEIKPDFFVVIAYGQILSKSILDIAKWNVNLHASLLPKYRGATPIQESIKNGDSETGVSIMDIAEKLDSGGVYKVHRFKISEFDTSGMIFDKVANIGKYLPDDLVEIAEGLTDVSQNEESVSFCTKIEKKDGEIIFKNETATDIYNKMRAFTPWPGVFFIHNGKRIKIISGRVSEDGIATKEGCFLPIKIVPEGKKEQSYEEWKRNN